MDNLENNQIDFRKILTAKVPKLMKHMPEWLFRKIQRLLHEEEINEALRMYSDREGVAFADAIVSYFNMKVVVNGIEHLREDQRIVVASNHPLGALDGIALLGVVGHERHDVIAPVNDFLLYLKNMRPLFIPVNKVGHGVAGKAENVRLFNETFEGEKPICYFPFGLCSRKTKGGKIMDLDWKKTFVTKAVATQRSIIPTHIDGRNTNFFYNLARLRKFLKIKANIEMAFLVDEMFKQRDKTLTITFGKPIPYETFDKRFTDAQWAEKLRTFSYHLTEDPNQVFNPEKEYII